MSTGLTIKKMKTEIQNILSGHHNLFGVYGFGSFFRSTEYNDIDLLLVSKELSSSPLEEEKNCLRISKGAIPDGQKSNPFATASRFEL